MAVDIERSTKIAPLSLSTSYLTGSACIGISMTTLKSLGEGLAGRNVIECHDDLFGVVGERPIIQRPAFPLSGDVPAPRRGIVAGGGVG